MTGLVEPDGRLCSGEHGSPDDEAAIVETRTWMVCYTRNIPRRVMLCIKQCFLVLGYGSTRRRSGRDPAWARALSDTTEHGK